MDLEGGVFTVVSENDRAETQEFSINAELRPASLRKGISSRKKDMEKVKTRTVKTMQWFNPSHIEQIEQAASKLQSPLRDSRRTLISAATTEEKNGFKLQKPPSQKDFKNAFQKKTTIK